MPIFSKVFLILNLRNRIKPFSKIGSEYLKFLIESLSV